MPINRIKKTLGGYLLKHSKELRNLNSKEEAINLVKGAIGEYRQSVDDYIELKVIPELNNIFSGKRSQEYLYNIILADKDRIIR